MRTGAVVYYNSYYHAAASTTNNGLKKNLNVWNREIVLSFDEFDIIYITIM